MICHTYHTGICHPDYKQTNKKNKKMAGTPGICDPGMQLVNACIQVFLYFGLGLWD